MVISSDDFSFRGGLVPCINQLFQLNHEVHGSSYGTAPNRQIIQTANSVTDVDFSVFNKDDPADLQMLVLVYHGTHFGFRGGEEHSKHMVDYLKEGVFEVGHELAGLPFIQLEHMPDKTRKLTINNTQLRSSTSSRIPIFEDDPNCPGMVLRRYLSVLGPGQSRMYCKIASPKQRMNWVGTDPKALVSTLLL